jgi:hypothetical protein
MVHVNIFAMDLNSNSLKFYVISSDLQQIPCIFLWQTAGCRCRAAQARTAAGVYAENSDFFKIKSRQFIFSSLLTPLKPVLQ